MITRIKEWCRHSETIGLAYAHIAAGVVIQAGGVVGAVLTDSDVKTSLGSFGLPPWFGLSLAVIGVLFFMARTRKASQDPL